ncbi:MAG: hypothetical protein PVH87_26230 [Desulfobacteraceae bacterium]|jgi:hypothetical protein
MTMNLKPHEILNKLGFEIGEEGLCINKFDYPLYNTALDMIGKAMTINFDLISDKELVTRFSALGAFKEYEGDKEDALKNLNASTQTTRAYLEAILGSFYRPVRQSDALSSKQERLAGEKA